MARRKEAHAGGHGWFVTFADLMGLLVAFFVMLVAFSTQDQAQLQVVAGGAAGLAEARGETGGGGGPFAQELPDPVPDRMGERPHRPACRLDRLAQWKKPLQTDDRTPRRSGQ